MLTEPFNRCAAFSILPGSPHFTEVRIASIMGPVSVKKISNRLAMRSPSPSTRDKAPARLIKSGADGDCTLFGETPVLVTMCKASGNYGQRAIQNCHRQLFGWV